MPTGQYSFSDIQPEQAAQPAGQGQYSLADAQPALTPKDHGILAKAWSVLTDPGKRAQFMQQLERNPGDSVGDAFAKGAARMFTGAVTTPYDLAKPAQNPDEAAVAAGGSNMPGGGAMALAIHRAVVAPASQQFDKAKQDFNTPGVGPKISGAGHALAAAIPVAGPLAADIGERAGNGDIAGAAGQAAALVQGPQLAREGKAQALKATDALKTKAAEITAGPQKAVMGNSIANMPMKAVDGAEDLFRAAAPPGGEATFRKSLYTAAGDLAEVGRKVNVAEAKGGIINPDMRVRATVNAINDHLSQMYNEERAPQIQRNAQAPVVTKFSADATEALQNIAKNGSDSATRALAAQALSEPALPLAQIDELARVVNRETAPMRGLTSQELAQVEGGSRKLAAAKALDSELGNKIETELTNRGEASIKPYEQRYAALSEVRDQLQKRMNMTELKQENIAKQGLSAIGVLRDPMAGASAAATANVSIGRMLQRGLQRLADSGMTAKRAVGSGAPPVKGLLGPGAIQLGSEMEPVGQPSSPPPTQSVSPQSRFAAQRSLQQALANLPVKGKGAVKVSR